MIRLQRMALPRYVLVMSANSDDPIVQQLDLLVKFPPNNTAIIEMCDATVRNRIHRANQNTNSFPFRDVVIGVEQWVGVHLSTIPRIRV